MSEPSTNGMNPLDPFGFWKTARDSNLEAWSKLMIDVVNSDEYSKATGTMLEQSLAASQPFRDSVEQVMTHSLSLLNMPSRAEVTTIADRLVNIEMRLDDLDAKISTVQKSLEATIRDAVSQAFEKQESHIKEVQTHLEKVDAKLTAQKAPVAASVLPQTKPEPKPEIKAQPEPTQSNGKKEQEAQK